MPRPRPTFSSVLEDDDGGVGVDVDVDVGLDIRLDGVLDIRLDVALDVELEVFEISVVESENPIVAARLMRLFLPQHSLGGIFPQHQLPSVGHCVMVTVSFALPPF